VRGSIGKGIENDEVISAPEQKVIVRIALHSFARLIAQDASALFVGTQDILHPPGCPDFLHCNTSAKGFHYCSTIIDFNP
jgi:hypothetical protein